MIYSEHTCTLLSIALCLCLEEMCVLLHVFVYSLKFICHLRNVYFSSVRVNSTFQYTTCVAMVAVVSIPLGI